MGPTDPSTRALRSRRGWRRLRHLAAASIIGASVGGTGLAVLAGPATAGAATSTTLYVATGGSDTTGSGAATTCQSSSSPCQTIQDAMDEAAAGDTIDVGPGSSTEQVVVTRPLSIIGAGTGTGASSTRIELPTSSTSTSDLTASDLLGGRRSSPGWRWRERRGWASRT
jgi:hypothetical protein